MAEGLSRTALLVAACSALAFPAVAKAPRPADEAAVREIVKGIYDGYSKPAEILWPENADGVPSTTAEAFKDGVDGYDIPYSDSFVVLIDKWESQLGDELWNMNGFDWYCQCQDFDNKTAKLESQRYLIQGNDRIDGKLRFSPMSGGASDITLRFFREADKWTLDDIIFDEGSTARQGLQQDMKDIAAEKAKQ